MKARKKPVRKLTERQAWLVIARQFEGEQLSATRLGLCFAVEKLRDSGRITFSMLCDMTYRIRTGPKKMAKEWPGYIWPTTPEYRPHRAKLARRFAKEAK